MPLPFILGGAAIVAGVTGVGTGIHGGMKMKDANDTMKAAQAKQEKAVKKFEANNTETTLEMDKLGRLELEILSSFDKFSDIIEKIQGRPEFKEIKMDGINLPEYEAEELKKVSAGAGALLGGIGGAAAGTAGGFAAAGVTTSAVMALGTASTGTAISTLSGVAATNATLAAIGGGSIASGGGGVALGTTILGGATLGVGLLVGGVIFSVTGSKLSDKADDAWNQAKKTEAEVDKIVNYLTDLRSIASNYNNTLYKVQSKYKQNLNALDYIVNFSEKIYWDDFTEKEKKTTENTVLLVGLLYKMCSVKLVLQNNNKDALNTVNRSEVNTMISKANNVLLGNSKNNSNSGSNNSTSTSNEKKYKLILMSKGYDQVKTAKLVSEVIGVGLVNATSLVANLSGSGLFLTNVGSSEALKIKQKFDDINCKISMQEV